MADPGGLPDKDNDDVVARRVAPTAGRRMPSIMKDEGKREGQR
jgi:hypothetical protein